jgi:hypothetical protein
MHIRVTLRRLTLLGSALALVACARKQAPPEDPAFESRWKTAASGAEVLTIGDDSGEALMGNVRRAGRPKGDDSPQTTGSLPAQLGGDQVQRVIRSNLASVKGCYISVARHTPRTGKAIVSFTVGADGRPSNVQVDAPSFQGTALPGCLTAQVSVWSFPPSQKGSGAVSYPFVFVGT